MFRRATLVVVIAIFGLVGVVLAVLGPATDRRLTEGLGENIGDSSFYSTAAPFPTDVPGAIVRTERLPSAPEGTVAWRVLYHSTDATGADIVTSGVVIAPTSAAPSSERVVVGWGHPTTGAVARCGPSRSIDPFILIEGLDKLLAAGYVVAAPDYPGLGLAGQSSYLIGPSEGNSLLDAIRAARTLTGAGAQTLLWGHSQGGHAVLFAAQSATRYAPELRVRAIAVAAPAADLGALLDDHQTDVSGVTLGSYSYAAYESAYGGTTPGLSLGSILTPAGVAATPKMAALCLIGQLSELHAIARPLVGGYTRSNPVTTAPWAKLLAENTPGAAPLGAPLLVAQGQADTLVLPAVTAKFVAGECAAGERVTFDRYPGVGHGGIALAAVPKMITFFQGVLKDQPPTSNC